MKDKQTVGYVVFHTGNEKGKVPFYLTKTRITFSSSLEVANIYTNALDAEEDLNKAYNRIPQGIECRKYLGIGRITFDVMKLKEECKLREVDGVWKNSVEAENLWFNDGVVPIKYLEGCYKNCKDVFAVPADSTVRIRCGSGSKYFYEVDCSAGDYGIWIMQLEEKSWYTGKIRETGNKYIKHFCSEWGNK